MEIAQRIEERLGQQGDLHRRHVNPALAEIDATFEKAHRLRGGLWDMGTRIVKSALAR